MANERHDEEIKVEQRPKTMQEMEQKVVMEKRGLSYISNSLIKLLGKAIKIVKASPLVND